MLQRSWLVSLIYASPSNIFFLPSIRPPPPPPPHLLRSSCGEAKREDGGENLRLHKQGADRCANTHAPSHPFLLSLSQEARLSLPVCDKPGAGPWGSHAHTHAHTALCMRLLTNTHAHAYTHACLAGVLAPQAPGLSHPGRGDRRAYETEARARSLHSDYKDGRKRAQQHSL